MKPLEAFNYTLGVHPRAEFRRMLLVIKVGSRSFLSQGIVAICGNSIEVDEQSTALFCGGGSPLSIAIETALDPAFNPRIPRHRRADDYRGSLALCIFDVLPQIPSICVNQFLLVCDRRFDFLS